MKLINCCNPDGITYPVPGNDDAIRSIALYCSLVSDAVLDGLQQEAIATGVDLGAAEEVAVEPLADPGEAENPVLETPPAAEQAPAS